MGKKRGKAAPDSPEAEDFMGGLSMLELGNEWNPGGPGGWGNNTHGLDDEDDDVEDEEDEEEEEEEEPVRQRGRRQPPQSYYQNPKQTAKGQQKHKVPQGNQGHPGQQNGRINNPHRSQENPQQRKQPQNQKKSKTNQKGQQGQKAPKQHQEPSGGAIPEWEVNEHGGWNVGGNYVGNVGGGGGDRGLSGNQSISNQHQQYQQRRLASLLEDIPEEGERTRGSNQQWPKKQGRPMTAAEHVKAAASGMAPSRTLLYAASSSATSILDGGSRGGPHTSISLLLSEGVALEEAERALYSRQRPASQRIHWMFSPTKEEKVAILIDWIQASNHGLATLGVHMFLRTQQRGALIANADFRSKKNPNAPAFDWVTFDDVIDTHDKILQESIAFYEPDNQVLVFVFLLSHSGNSLAMWRRKLAVPIAVRNQNHIEITRLINALARRKYVVTVDELPRPLQTKSKRKWLPW